MARYHDIDVQMANLGIEEEENDAVIIEGDEEDIAAKYELCAVGRFLTGKNINVRAMKSKLADIWKPALGINIKELEEGIFLFQFYHKEDLQWVLNGGPWSFDNAMLVIAAIPQGMEPLYVPLWHLKMWIQIHDLPTGYMSEAVGKQLGDFFGEFLEYDQKNNTSIWRECMRIRVLIDVRKPLKRKKKILRKNGQEVIVMCKYERLGEFCFSCGMVSHTERYCKKFLDKTEGVMEREWGNWLKAPPRRMVGPVKSKWLREDGDMDWEDRAGRSKFRGGSYDKDGKGFSQTSNQGDKDKVVMQAGNTHQLLKLGANNEVQDLNSNLNDGLEEDELNGLNIVDRKRLRGSPDTYEVMDTPGGLKGGIGHIDPNNQNGVALSNSDCVTSQNNGLATLALQASRSQ